ncbi:MAG: glycosyltransferase family 4 protein [Dehalococcoidales bacterium]
MIDDGLRINAVLVGDGKLLEVYKAECKDYQSISFLGRLDNPLPVMRACDLIVVPSMADSCPNTVMEALYNETPVIGTKSGGIPEILNDEMALFENNANSLAEKIVELSHKGNLLKLKEKQKTRKAELTFEWSEKIYQHLGLS